MKEFAFPGLTKRNRLLSPRRPSKSTELAERESGPHYSGHSGALARRHGRHRHVLFVFLKNHSWLYPLHHSRGYYYQRFFVVWTLWFIILLMTPAASIVTLATKTGTPWPIPRTPADGISLNTTPKG